MRQLISWLFIGMAGIGSLSGLFGLLALVAAARRCDPTTPDANAYSFCSSNPSGDSGYGLMLLLLAAALIAPLVLMERHKGRPRQGESTPQDLTGQDRWLYDQHQRRQLAHVRKGERSPAAYTAPGEGGNTDRPAGSSAQHLSFAWPRPRARQGATTIRQPHELAPTDLLELQARCWIAAGLIVAGSLLAAGATWPLAGGGLTAAFFDLLVCAAPIATLGSLILSAVSVDHGDRARSLQSALVGCRLAGATGVVAVIVTGLLSLLSRVTDFFGREYDPQGALNYTHNADIAFLGVGGATLVCVAALLLIQAIRTT